MRNLNNLLPNMPRKWQSCAAGGFKGKGVQFNLVSMNWPVFAQAGAAGMLRPSSSFSRWKARSFGWHLFCGLLDFLILRAHRKRLRIKPKSLQGEVMKLLHSCGVPRLWPCRDTWADALHSFKALCTHRGTDLHSVSSKGKSHSYKAHSNL